MIRKLSLALPLLCVQLASAQSAVPGSISYQGRVTDASGVPVGEAGPVNRKITLRVYDSTSGTTPLYAEEQTVTINKGIFSVLVGTGLQVGSEPRPAIAGVFNGAERYLGVTVDDGTPAADPEISPRQQIVSTAYAFTARAAEVAGSVSQASGTSTMNVLEVNSLTAKGASKITGQNTLEFGNGRPKAATAGVIGYQVASAGLDIYGAGENQQSRKLTLWAEGGTDVKGAISFGERMGQHLNLWGTQFGVGVQSSTLYQRTGGNFAWYAGGSHNDGSLNGGGGTLIAQMSTGGLTLNSGNLSVPNGKIQGRIDLGGHGVFASSYNDGHAFGSQDYTTFSRSSRSFAWYVGGSFDAAELNNGGGTTAGLLTGDGLVVGGQSLRVGGNTGGQEANAGVIGYRKLSGDSLDIAGAGTNATNRRIKLWAEGGTEMTGGLNASGNITSTGGNVEGQDVRARSWVYCNNLVYRNSNGNYRWETRGVGDYEFVFDGTTRYRIDGNGNTYKVSDRALKKDIEPLDGTMAKVMRLKPASYHFKSDSTEKPLSFGFIAQEVREVFPELVTKIDEDTVGLNYEGLIPVAVSAIQEQQRMLKEKDAEIAALKQELAAARETNTLQDTRLASIEKALKLETPSAPVKKETKVASRR